MPGMLSHGGTIAHQFLAMCLPRLAFGARRWCLLLAFTVAAAVVRWQSWLLFDVYPLQGCAAARTQSVTPHALGGSDDLAYLLLNLNRSSVRLAATTHELAAAGITSWTRVPAVDRLFEGKSLRGIAEAFVDAAAQQPGQRKDAIALVEAGLKTQWRGRVDGYLLALQASLVRALHKGVLLRRKRAQLSWLVILEDDVALSRDFDGRLRKLAAAQPHADMLWLDKRSWWRSWLYAEPSCCTAAIAVHVDAALRLATAMTPGSEELSRHLARRLVRQDGWPPSPWPQQLYLPALWSSGKPSTRAPNIPVYDFVLSDLCVNEGLCCVVRKLARDQPMPTKKHQETEHRAREEARHNETKQSSHEAAHRATAREEARHRGHRRSSVGRWSVTKPKPQVTKLAGNETAKRRNLRNRGAK